MRHVPRDWICCEYKIMLMITESSILKSEKKKYWLSFLSRIRQDYPIYDDYKRSTIFNELLSITDHLCMCQNGSFSIYSHFGHWNLMFVRNCDCIKAMAK